MFDQTNPAEIVTIVMNGIYYARDGMKKCSQKQNGNKYLTDFIMCEEVVDI